MIQPSTIEISEAALRANLRFITSQLNEHTVLSSVIKGNAYGHGIETFVPLAERCGVTHFSVFSADEAYRVAKVCAQASEIAIMGALDDEQVEWAVENGISFFVFDLERLRAAVSAADKLKVKARIHLELETGLYRTGLDGAQLEDAVDLMRKHSALLDLTGVCTHFAGAESENNYLRIQRQIETFHKQLRWLDEHDIHARYRHAACSAAVFTYPSTILDMVRVGIAQYGFWPSRETMMVHRLRSGLGDQHKTRDPLRRVMRWKSRIMTVKTVPAGKFVGYGTSYMTTRKQRIAIIPIGYFHGFARVLSNAGKVLVNGRMAQVIGMVNMNMITVDVTDHAHVNRGDEVVIIGGQKRMSITVASFSEMTKFLNYEVLVRIPPDIPRVVVA